MKKQALFWLFFLGGLYLIVMLSRDLWRLLSADRRVGEAGKKMDILVKKREELQLELKWVETDEFVEKEAREKLMLSRPGEKTVMLPKVAEVSQVAEVAKEKKGNLPPWRQWLALFWY